MRKHFAESIEANCEITGGRKNTTDERDSPACRIPGYLDRNGLPRSERQA
ncbi:hypothetical protein RHECNPAF_930021 [Rhizobium etli CNPAF512]|nr:hypothetical protein RHECNPAF_930021 [Rhizobium etli CNPAF512]